MTEPVFTGVGVALITLFHDNGSVDVESTAELAGALVDAGVRAVVVAGTTGEAASLDPAERVALLHAIRPVTAGRVPLLAGVGAPSTQQALAHVRAAIDEGVDAVLALSLPGGADQRRYYDTLAERAATTPLLAYHYPAASAPGIPVGLLRELPISGVKDSSGEPDRILEMLETFDQPIYTGSSAVLSLAGTLGCTGAILALANAEPEACIAAFGGDASAQRTLAGAHLESRRSFPDGIKGLTAKRFGTSTVARMG